MGNDNWLLVDSCIDPHTKLPATAHYLDQIAVGTESVKGIVASHWHDDHVRGLSLLTKKYSKSSLFFSVVLSNDEAAELLTAYSGTESLDLSRGTNELYKAIAGSVDCVPSMHRTLIYEGVLEGKAVVVTALSPLPEAFKQFVANFAQYLPQPGLPITHIPTFRPNIESVVVHVKIGDESILLGSDLEQHNDYGWSALAENAWCISRGVASTYKVAHHGSLSGDHPDVWRRMLKGEPTAILSPFVLGRHKLPTAADRIRIEGVAPGALITSRASAKPTFEASQLKRLKSVCKNLTPVNNGFGCIRLRKKVDDAAWDAEIFGDAGRL